jgi:sulfide:quinone oxidoreductase
MSNGLSGAPRNDEASRHSWAETHAAKVGFERYFLRKIRIGKSEPFYERLALQMLGIDKLKAIDLDKD